MGGEGPGLRGTPRRCGLWRWRAEGARGEGKVPAADGSKALELREALLCARPRQSCNRMAPAPGGWGGWSVIRQMTHLMGFLP